MIAVLNMLVWVPWLLGLFLATGIYLTLRSGLFQLTGLPRWLCSTLRTLKRPSSSVNGSNLTPFQAVATALGSTVGTGSIAGVATAIALGGPGAVFWMWTSAFLGMMTGFVEKTLAVRYRRKGRDGRWHGGPMYYMRDGLGWRKAAVFFSAVCALSALLGGNMVQVNSIADALEAACGLPRPVSGLGTAVLTGAVVLGGVNRIGGLCERLVPLMALLFLLGGCAVIVSNRQALLPVLQLIWQEAFRPESAAGGAAGCGVLSALRYGVARGVFTNEAGVGSSAIAHAASGTDDSVSQGFWGMFEVFAATLVICTISALAILTSGVSVPYNSFTPIDLPSVPAKGFGVSLSLASFSSVLGQGGALLLTLCLLLFAFTSILGWSYYGEQALGYLTGGRTGVRCYRLIFLGAILWGSAVDTSLAWQLTDLCTALMALPNLCALLLLSPEVFRLLNKRRTRPKRL